MAIAVRARGQEGDQELVRGNWAIADRSPDIHLFKNLKDGFVEYVHQMFYADHLNKPGVDKLGKERELVIFKLWKYRAEHLKEALAAKRRGARPDIGNPRPYACCAQ
jgi:hypothetical protein